MVTFTLPSALRKLCRNASAEKFYRCFFASSSQAIKDVLADQRHLGGQCGFFGLFQSWRQDLRLHPHIHYLVPAIALDDQGKPRGAPKAGWLARGEVFAARLRTLLLKALSQEGLLSESEMEPLWKIPWNCDVEDFGDGENAMKYLGAYLCKGPISDSRILGICGEKVRIAIKERQSGRHRAVVIEGVEFVRRYLNHALPSGFHRIRYYGFLHSKAKAKLERIRAQLALRRPPAAQGPETQEAPPTMPCPHCGKPMSRIGYRSRAPPHRRSISHIWNRSKRTAA